MIRRPLAICALLVACDGTCGRTPPPAVSIDAGAPLRTPAQIRVEGNHLAQSRSAYLQMHAHNPVDWYPWGDEAFRRAKAENKPVFLSIGYASCHWCHVMEAEVFSKDDVAELVNARFVAIKVDREERPDVDAIYVEAVAAMTGSAGWPLSVFLTPDLKPFYGATYLPHDAFLAAARKGADELTASRADVETRAQEIYARVAVAPEANTAGARVRGTEVVEAARRAVDRVDPSNGGFRGRQKFPNAVRWRMMLHAWRKSGDASVRLALEKTLLAIGKGGLRDHVGGGFYRYTVDPTWTVPHFEKMLYVNALLADLFLEAGAALDPAYTDVALDTLDFMLRDMRLADGTFAASLDADDPAGEGRFYTWTPKEIADATGDVALAAQLGVTDAGNFDGRTVLTRRGPASSGWEHARPKLLLARAKRPAPKRDDKAITSWNALAVSALARAASRTNDARFRSAATAAGERLLKAHVTPDGVARAVNADAPSLPGTLDDYAALARAMLDLFETTGDRAYVERAVALVDEANAKLGAPDGGFRNVADPRTGRVDLFDSEEPNGNALLAEAVLRLAALTARAPLYDLADRTLAAYADQARMSGLGMASWLDASLLADGPFYDVVIVGAPALVDAWRAILPPWAVHAEIPGPSEDALLPALSGKIGPAAYVCVRGACKLPARDVAAFRAQLAAGWAR